MADMISNPAAAASAYANMAKTASISGGLTESASSSSKASFGNMLEESVRGAIDTLKQGERASAAGVTGTMDPLAITQAVTDAKLTLDTFAAVRDAAIEAYNKIQNSAI
ncbi:MAG TPA: flagellar hook-basal body complex protein FliE [Alphaproteobacteria bacterium]|nr:flagellar hook-basal body complex protein FliE [Alphaproteobacteria bacterium]